MPLMNSCLFCNVVNKEIHTEILHQDDSVVVFRDINPQAPFHALVIPRQHIASLADSDPSHTLLLGQLLRAGADIAKQHGYDQSGYRAVINTNRDGGQTVFHIHLHILAGRPFSWPPG